jgi:virulence-associated protein VapD
MRIERVERLTKAYVDLTAAIAAARFANKKTSGYSSQTAAEKAAENIALAITDECGPRNVVTSSSPIPGVI